MWPVLIWSYVTLCDSFILVTVQKMIVFYQIYGGKVKFDITINYKSSCVILCAYGVRSHGPFQWDYIEWQVASWCPVLIFNQQVIANYNNRKSLIKTSCIDGVSFRSKSFDMLKMEQNALGTERNALGTERNFLGTERNVLGTEQ